MQHLPKSLHWARPLPPLYWWKEAPTPTPNLEIPVSLNINWNCFSFLPTVYPVLIMIMYIYHALTNALSTHIHINLNIFYTHIEHSPTKTAPMEKQHPYTHTMNSNVDDTDLYRTSYMHTRNDCSRNWVLILVGAKILWEEEGFQFSFEK